MNLGDNIRRIRQERGMTQSALAEVLGVSDRAVSRWERGTSSPDITTLTRLALTLDASADALLGVDPQRIQADILADTEECTRLLNADDAANAVAFMREKNAQYPHQPELMVYLALALLRLSTDDTAREALALCRAAESAVDAGHRTMRLSTTFGCKKVMARALHRLGKSEQAAQLIEDEMPAIWVSRELLLPRYAPPERAQRIRRSNAALLTGLLESTLQPLAAEDPAYAGAIEALHELQRALP